MTIPFTDVITFIGALAGIVLAARAMREARAPEMKLALESLQGQIADLKTERAAHLGRIERLEAAIEDGRTRVLELERVNAGLTTRVSELQAGIGSRDHEIAKLRQELGVANQRIRMLENPGGRQGSQKRGGRT